MTTSESLASASHQGPYRTVSTVRAAWGATGGMVVLIVLAVAPGTAKLFGIIFGVPWLVATWRAWILGVYVEPGGVRLVQYVTTKRLAWSDIDHFAVLPVGNYPFVGQVVVRGRHRPIVIAGMGAAARPNPEAKRLQVQRPIDELNQVLAEWRQRSGHQAVESTRDGEGIRSGSPTAVDLDLSFRASRVQILTTGSIGVTVVVSLAIIKALSPVASVGIGCVVVAYALILVGYFHCHYQSRLVAATDHETGLTAGKSPLPRGIRVYAASVVALETATLVSVLAVR